MIDTAVRAGNVLNLTSLQVETSFVPPVALTRRIPAVHERRWGQGHRPLGEETENQSQHEEWLGRGVQGLVTLILAGA